MSGMSGSAAKTLAKALCGARQNGAELTAGQLWHRLSVRDKGLITKEDVAAWKDMQDRPGNVCNLSKAELEVLQKSYYSTKHHHGVALSALQLWQKLPGSSRQRGVTVADVAAWLADRTPPPGYVSRSQYHEVQRLKARPELRRSDAPSRDAEELKRVWAKQQEDEEQARKRQTAARQRKANKERFLRATSVKNKVWDRLATLDPINPNASKDFNDQGQEIDAALG